MKNLVYLFSLLLLTHIRESRSYSTGAPSDRVCESMLPGHGTFKPQSGDSPYIINLSSTDVKGGDSVRVTLTSKTGATDFKGFLTIAQKSDGNLKNTGSGIPAGNFKLSASGTDSNAQFVKCGEVGDGAVTHTSGEAKKSVTFDWVVPNEDGDFIILATVVKSFDTFWVKQPSGVIRVKRNAALGETKPTTTTPKPEKALSVETVKRLADFYTSCGETKGCFGMPVGCISKRSCDMFTTFRVEGPRYIFQVAGKLPNPSIEKGYVAVGLSFDNKMNDDSVVGCLKDGNNVSPYSYHNFNWWSTGLPNPTDGMYPDQRSGSEIDGVIFCEFNRTSTLTIAGTVFDLENGEFHILLARDSNNAISQGTLSQHSDMVASPVPLKLSSTSIIDETEKEILTGKFYNDCGVTKGCFGHPRGCVTSWSCDLFTSFDKDFNFQVTGRLANNIGHVSVGLSFDRTMGRDSVIGCVVLENGDVAAKSYYNVPTAMGNLIMKDSTAGIDSVGVTAIIDGDIFCEFKRTPSLSSPDEITADFNLVDDEYFLIMAKADLVEPDKLGKHVDPDNDKAVAAYAVNLKNTTKFESELELLLLKFYSGCGVTKGCFGVPDPCVTDRSCEMLLTFNEALEFQLHGKLEAGATVGHVSMGLSFDNLMGQDSVTGCVLEENVVRVKSYYNIPDDKRNQIMNNETDGLEGESVGIHSEGMLFCEFTRSELLESPDELEETFDLLSDEYYILLARAMEITTGENGKEQLGRHANPGDRGISPRILYLNETEIIEKGPDEPIDGPEAERLKSKYYGGCGETKGCFGFPNGCISSRNCDMFVSFNGDLLFQITGQLPNVDQGHISVGLSFDDKMGDDSVTGCVLSNSAVRPISFYNYVDSQTSRKSNAAMSNRTAGLETIIGGTGQYLDGIVFCEFVRSPIFALNEGGLNLNFNLQKDEYYIMLARAGSASDSGLGFHNNDKLVSAEKTSLSSTDILGGKSNILIELHAGLMIIAWLMCASTGMFTARYYKQTHTDFNPLNKAFWFVLHIFCMFTTVFLSISGGIIIFIEVGGYSSGIEGVGSLHPILGLVLSGLALMQVLIAFFRPHPGTARRPLFNWIHWTIGNSAHIVGIACIFLAKDLSKSGLSRDDEKAYIPVVVGFVVFHVVMHVVMAIHTLWADKQMDAQVKMRSVRPGPMKPSGKSDEAPGTRLRTAILIMYMAGCAGVAITLIVLVVGGLNN